VHTLRRPFVLVAVWCGKPGICGHRQLAQPGWPPLDAALTMLCRLWYAACIASLVAPVCRSVDLQPVCGILDAIVGAFCAAGPTRAVVLSDLGGPVHIRHKPKRLFPPASLIKPLLADTVIHRGTDLGIRVPISQLHETRYPTILAAFEPEHTLSVAELVSLSLVVSDNAAADYLLDLVGLDAVNEHARQLGMTGTSVATGFHDQDFARAHRNMTTADDIATLFGHLYRNRTQPGHDLIWRALQNNLRNHRLPAQLPDDLPFAHKTGSLRDVCHDAGVMQLSSGPLLLVVLTQNEPDSAHLSLEMARLARAVYDCVTGWLVRQASDASSAIGGPTL